MKKLILAVVLALATQSLALNMSNIPTPSSRQLALVALSASVAQFSSPGTQSDSKFTAELAIGLSEPEILAVTQLGQRLYTKNIMTLSSALTMINTAGAKALNKTGLPMHEAWIWVAHTNLIFSQLFSDNKGLIGNMATGMRDYKIAGAANNAVAEYLKYHNFSEPHANLYTGIVSGVASLLLLGKPTELIEQDPKLRSLRTNAAMALALESGLRFLPSAVATLTNNTHIQDGIGLALGLPVIILVNAQAGPAKTSGEALMRNWAQATGISFAIGSIMKKFATKPESIIAALKIAAISASSRLSNDGVIGEIKFGSHFSLAAHNETELPVMTIVMCANAYLNSDPIALSVCMSLVNGLVAGQIGGVSGHVVAFVGNAALAGTVLTLAAKDLAAIVTSGSEAVTSFEGIYVFGEAILGYKLAATAANALEHGIRNQVSATALGLRNTYNTPENKNDLAFEADTAMLSAGVTLLAVSIRVMIQSNPGSFSRIAASQALAESAYRVVPALIKLITNSPCGRVVSGISSGAAAWGVLTVVGATTPVILIYVPSTIGMLIGQPAELGECLGSFF